MAALMLGEERCVACAPGLFCKHRGLGRQVSLKRTLPVVLNHSYASASGLFSVVISRI